MVYASVFCNLLAYVDVDGRAFPERISIHQIEILKIPYTGWNIV